MSGKPLVQAIEDIARGLVSVSHEEEGSIFSTPALYPSGAPVRVRASFDGRTCFVSDMGFAAHEAEMLGATQRQFANQARSVAERFGVSFDNQSFFVVQVPVERIGGAIKIIAAASHESTILTEAHISEQAKRNDRELLIDRLVSVFGRSKVDEDVEITGQSGHVWTLVGRVRASHDVAFDCASASPASVSWVHTKFSDIHRRDQNFRGIVTVQRLSAFKKDYLGLLEQAASEVIEVESPNDVYSRLAA